MDSFELTKIAGAVLAALLVIFGTKTFIEISGHGHSAKPGYTLPSATPKAEAKPAEAGAPAAGGEAATGNAPAGGDPGAETVALLPKANADNGKTIFSKCKSCHSTDKGKNGVGPTLYGLVNRPKAAIDGYKYSDAMKAKGGEWHFADLAKFLAHPKVEVPDTKMSFAGLKSAQDRADLIAYLATIGDSPVELPK